MSQPNLQVAPRGAVAGRTLLVAVWELA